MKSFSVSGTHVHVVEELLQEADDAEDDVPAFFFSSENMAAATGGKVWESAKVALEVLEEKSNLFRGKHVLELGCGTGLLGMACAVLGAERVVLTDLPSVLSYYTTPSLAQNPALSSIVSCLAVDWTDFNVEAIPESAVIIASDCVWLLEFLGPFVQCLRALLARDPGNIALIAQTERATENSTVFASTANLLDQLDGLTVSVLKSEGTMAVYLVKQAGQIQ